MRKICFYLLFIVFIKLSAQDQKGNSLTIQTSFKNALRYYDSFGEVKDSMIAVCSNGLYGYIDLNGNLIIRCNYTWASNFSEGLAKVVKQENTKKVNDPIWNFDQSFEFVYIDKKGETAISTPFSICGDFHNGRAYVMGKNNKYGFINNRGDEIIPCIYDEVRDFSDSIALVRISDTLYYIDTEGKRISQEFHNISLITDFHDGYAAIMDVKDLKAGELAIYNNSQWGYMNKKMSIVIPTVYGEVFRFSESKAVVSLYDKSGYCPFVVIDKSNNVIYKNEEKYRLANVLNVEQEIFPSITFGDDGELLADGDGMYNRCFFSEGLLAIENTYILDDKAKREPEIVTKCGFMDIDGNVIIPFMYDMVSPFSCGLAYVKLFCGELGMRSGFVDKQGNHTFTDEEVSFYKNLKLIPWD